MVEFRTGGVGVLDASTGKSSDSDDCERVSKLSIGLIGFISISSFECISVCCGRPAERQWQKDISIMNCMAWQLLRLVIGEKSVDKLELTAIIVAGATAAAVVAVIVFHISTA